MSLARNLMSSVSGPVDVSGYDYSGCAIAESTWVDSACESLISDIYKVDKAYHTADIIGQVQVMQEGANPEVLLEGIVKSGIEKIKEAFRKFWAKLKEWFKKVKDYFKAMFLTGSKFVKEFKKAIQDKKADGFKYTAFKYTLDSGEWEAVFKKVEEKISDLTDAVIEIPAQYNKISTDALKAYNDRYKANIKGETKNPNTGEDAPIGHQWVETKAAETKKSYHGFDNEALKRSLKIDIGELSASEFQDDFIKKLGKKSDDITELTDYLKATFRDGDDEESEWEDFESNSKEDMMSLIENGGKAISDIERAEKKFENAINSIIKAYDKVKSTDESGEAGYKVAQKISGYLSALLAVGKVPSTTKVDAYKEAMASYERILKSFLRWKPVKEGYEGYGSMEPATESLLDAAYRLI